MLEYVHTVYIDVTEIQLSSVIEKVGRAAIWTNWQPNIYIFFLMLISVTILYNLKKIFIIVYSTTA